MAPPSDEELTEFLEMFPNLSDPDHFPRQFQYYWKFYKFVKSIKPNDNSEIQKA